MIKAGIVGATGYAGGELVRILLAHPEVKIMWYGSKSYIDKPYAEVYQNMFRLVEDICKDDNLKEMAKQVDVIFTATASLSGNDSNNGNFQTAHSCDTLCQSNTLTMAFRFHSRLNFLNIRNNCPL